MGIFERPEYKQCNQLLEGMIFKERNDSENGDVGMKMKPTKQRNK